MVAQVVNKVSAFLSRHNFQLHSPPINSVIAALLYDMQSSLDAPPAPKTPLGGAQEMIPTYANPPKNPPKNTQVIVIDAGGTNFRSCVVSFDAEGAPTISNFQKASMPGIERELNRKDFFAAIVKNLEHLKDVANKFKGGVSIGFCFSYAMRITPDGDGEVLSFSKEIKAKEVVGAFVGAELTKALVQNGWHKPRKITLLNDTMAALLAGYSNAIGGKKFSSYIGFILGTGMNSAYIESQPIGKIAKQKKLPPQQIIVCEAGAFNKVVQCEFDLAFDKTTNTPGTYLVEKMCGGAYLGPNSCLMLKCAAKEGLFSPSVAAAISALKTYSLKDIDQFMYTPFRTDTLFGAMVAKGTPPDYETLYLLIDAYIERAARMAASLISAAVIKSGAGKNPTQPVCVLCDGTTFYKTFNLRPRVLAYLQTALTDERGIYFETVNVENAITIGAAVAGLI